MRITVKYMAQLRQAMGTAVEERELHATCTVAGLIRQLGENPACRRMLLDAHNEPHRALLVFVGDEQVPADSLRILNHGEQVTLLTPMAGG